MEISKITNKALDKYFESLSKLGYSKTSDVCRLLALSFIDDLLTGELKYFVTEKDYLTITNALYCLSGDCLIPFSSYLTLDNIYRQPIRKVKYKITEDLVTRITWDSFRVV